MPCKQLISLTIWAIQGPQITMCKRSHLVWWASVHQWEGAEYMVHCGTCSTVVPPPAIFLPSSTNIHISSKYGFFLLYNEHHTLVYSPQSFPYLFPSPADSAKLRHLFLCTFICHAGQNKVIGSEGTMHRHQLNNSISWCAESDLFCNVFRHLTAIAKNKLLMNAEHPASK